jgi:threonine/homoserine/homoserine lactone efflux protein
MHPVLVALLAFIPAAALLTIAPGVDTVLVLRAAASGGPRHGAAAAVGVGLGCLAWGLAAATGLTALLTFSHLGFTVLKWLGAAYLVWLGLKLLARPRSGLAALKDDLATRGDHALAGSFRRGFVTNMLNPKVGLFYLTFLPQFIPAGVSVGPFSMVLAGIHVGLGLAWFAILIALTVPLGRWLARPRVTSTMDRAAGALFLAFGIKLALTRPA